MRRIRRHPLQSFRFWFLVLTAVAMTTAWKLDLFGNRGADDDADVLAEELPPPPETDDLGPEFVMTDEISGGQSEPAPEPPPRPFTRASGARPAETADARDAAVAADDGPAVTAAPAEPATSPFGPADPEFVAAPADRVASTAPAEASPEPTPPGSPFSSVRQAEFVPAEADAPRQTAMLEQSAPSGAVSRRRIPFGKDSKVVPASGSQQSGAPTAASIAPATSETAEPEVSLPATPGDQFSPGSVIDLEEVDHLVESGDDVSAHRLLSQWYWKEPESRPAIMDRLETLARRIYLQPQPHYMDPRVVQAGDVLQTISRDYNVSWQYLAKLNRTDPRRIRPGQKLKVIKGPFSAVIDLSDFELTIHAHGYFVKRYPIGIGRDESSPIGRFEVEEKLEDPTYYGPDAVIEHDDPTNPLGEHWISIGGSFGIHGTINADSIGKAESKGCIRLRNEDVAEVYDFLTIGSEVVIRR
jgi:hypothetical protein